MLLKSRVDFSTDLSNPQKLLLLSQLYINQLKGQFTIKHHDRKITLFGEVRELSRKEISIKTSEGYRLVQLDNILQIQLLENHIHSKKATTYIMWLLLLTRLTKINCND